MQELRHFQPSTVSRRLSVVCGFYRTCVLDAVLSVSPAENVRRPPLPIESPTLGHLQFEAMLSGRAAAASSTRVGDVSCVTEGPFQPIIRPVDLCAPMAYTVGVTRPYRS